MSRNLVVKPLSSYKMKKKQFWFVKLSITAAFRRPPIFKHAHPSLVGLLLLLPLYNVCLYVYVCIVDIYEPSAFIRSRGMSIYIYYIKYRRDGWRGKAGTMASSITGTCHSQTSPPPSYTQSTFTRTHT